MPIASLPLPVSGVIVIDCLVIATLFFFASFDTAHGNTAASGTCPVVSTIEVPEGNRLELPLAEGLRMEAGGGSRMELLGDAQGLFVVAGAVRVTADDTFAGTFSVSLDGGTVTPRPGACFVVAHSAKRDFRALFVLRGIVDVNAAGTTVDVEGGHKAALVRKAVVIRNFEPATMRTWWAAAPEPTAPCPGAIERPAVPAPVPASASPLAAMAAGLDVLQHRNSRRPVEPAPSVPVAPAPARTDEVPGPAMAWVLPIGLGGAGITLEGLVQSYTPFINAGLASRLGDGITGQPRGPNTQVLTESAAWQVTDILAGGPQPDGINPFVVLLGISITATALNPRSAT